MADKTNDELMAELDKLGVEYAKDAKKDALKALLAEAKRPMDPEPAASPEAAGNAADDVEKGTPDPEPKDDAERAASAPHTASVGFLRVKLTDATAKTLNVRIEPAGAVIQTVPDGSVLESLGDEEDGWIPVKVVGYVMASLVEPTE